MWRPTSAEWTPSARASAQAASTAAKPSVSTADSTLTISVAIIRAPQLTPHELQAGRQEPVLEGGAVTQGTGLPGEHRHVMPGIVDRLAAAEAAAMLAGDCALLADHNVIGIGLDLDRPSHGARGDRVLVVIEAYQAGLGDRRLRRVEPVEWPGICTSCGRSASKACQIVRSASSGCLCALA